MLIIYDDELYSPVFHYAKEYLTSIFTDVSVITKSQFKPVPNEIIITNCPITCKESQIFFYACDKNMSSGENTFASSILASKHLQARLQYPYFPEFDFPWSSTIGCNDPDTLQTALVQLETTIKYVAKYEDLFDIDIYVHYPIDNEYVNWQIPAAARCGITTVTIDSGCLKEFLSPYDVIVQSPANTKQWVQAMKVALRDYMKNKKNIKNFAKRWSNLDDLADKVRQRGFKKVKKNTQEEIEIKPRKSIAETRTEAVKRRYLQKPPKQTIIPPKPSDDFPVFDKVYQEPTILAVESPKWFQSEDRNYQVSVIIPLFRSAEEIVSQIRNWDLLDRTDYEIVYVNDGCPQNSGSYILPTWDEVRRGYNQTIGQEKDKFREGFARLVNLSNNSGFGQACNFGARFARGEYLVFLNADTVPTVNWLGNLLTAIKNKQHVGIVGNLQLKTDGGIDSAGSEWMWDSRNFEHIGRNVYKGKRLSKTFHYKNMPADLLQQGERDMVTGCCFIVRRALFEDIGGFNSNYRIAYWEDSDFNMEVKSRGYKVVYEPTSVIYHKGSHSKAFSHPFIINNALYFYNKWVNNGKIDSLVNIHR